MKNLWPWKIYDLEKLMWPPDPRESFYLTTLQEHLYTFGVEVKFTRNGELVGGCLTVNN